MMMIMLQMDASTLTDPDCLGPCDPGTSVVLEGLVWAESNNGKYSYHSSVYMQRYSLRDIVLPKYLGASPIHHFLSPPTSLPLPLPPLPFLFLFLLSGGSRKKYLGDLAPHHLEGNNG